MADPNDNSNQPFPAGDVTYVSSTTGTRRIFLPGELIDNTYRLTALLGHGGMGVVFACHHAALGKDYALKLLNGDQLSGEHWSRFQAEAKALAKLNHPGIVGVHNMGIDGGQYPYYVMDLLSGETLDLVIAKSGRLSVDEALNLFIQVADALSFAHAQGIIHRDIKPSNLMVVRDDLNKISAIKLVDFGIARLSKQGFAAQSQTATGLVFGTPYYMSPEQCQGMKVDERSDIYSFGCALFETLTGNVPFCGDNSFHTFMLHQTAAPPTLASDAPEANFPQSLELAVGKMLAKKAADRYQSMAQLKHDLERIKAGKEIMVRGLGTTIQPAPPQNADPAQTGRLPARATVDQSGRRPATEVQAQPQPGGQKLSKSTMAGIVIAVVLVGAGSCAFLLYRPAKPPPKAAITPVKIDKKPSRQINEISVGFEDVQDLANPLTDMFSQGIAADKDLKEIGASTREIADFRKFDMVHATAEGREFEKEFKTYLAATVRPGVHFKKRTPTLEFQFPSQFIFGQIRFDHDQPIRATGEIALPPGKKVSLILSHMTRGNPEILDMFGPGDLNGLEIISNNTAKVIDKIKSWTSLEDLSFFNSLEKSLPQYKDWDESNITDAQLPLLEKMSALRTLGLCGDQINGPTILKMPLLKRLEGLKLKRIQAVEPLLTALPSRPNIKELWLIAMPITDSQLEPLCAMKNLQTLRIRRSHLTPASLEYFRRMPALKNLILDRPWSDADKKQFRKAFQKCEFEPVLDHRYWIYYPDQVEKKSGD